MPRGFIAVHEVSEVNGRAGRIAVGEIAAYFPVSAVRAGARVVLAASENVLDVTESVEEIDRLIEEEQCRS